MSEFLVGQDRVEHALKNALEKKRLAHGLLFAGPPGSGREKAARGLAAGLLCEKNASGDVHAGVWPWGCQQCRNCRRAMSGNHPDVHVLMPELEAVKRGIAQPDGKKKPSADILVDAVRDLVARMHLAPYEGGARIAIVVDAHRMNVNAQNALLKTLEEPSAKTFLVLIVPHERTVLPTIGSRCLRLHFAPVQKPDDAAPIEGPGSALLAAMLHGSAEERLDAAEALGKERSDVDAALADVEQRLIDAARRDVLPGWRAASTWIERVADAREALKQNASAQLCLEQLLLSEMPVAAQR